MGDLNTKNLEKVLRDFGQMPVARHVNKFVLMTDLPVGTERVVGGKRYRLVDDGPGRAKVMRVLDDGKLEDI